MTATTRGGSERRSTELPSVVLSAAKDLAERPPSLLPAGGPSLRSGRQEAHAGLMFPLRITLAHFSISPAISVTSSAGGIGMGTPPRSANRACILGSARPALISRPILSTISAGVPRGAPTPYHALTS